MNLNNPYYVYIYIDPTKTHPDFEEGCPFYIGKGKGRRWKFHLTESKEKTSNHQKWHKINDIRTAGFEPIVIIYKKELIEEDALNLEKNLVKKYGRKIFDNNGILTNILEGGLETVNLNKLPPEVKERVRQASIGRRASEETRKKMSEAGKGKIFSDEHKNKIGNAHRGKKLTEEQKENLRQKHTGKKCSEKTKKKMSESSMGQVSPNKGKKYSEEHKKSISIRNTGNGNPMYQKKHSEESKQKMRNNRKKIEEIRTPSAKLNENDIIKIRKLRSEENMKQADIAKLFYVSRATITLILTGKTWNHI